jgi:hypothetical protein
MEDIRTYRFETDEERQRKQDDERREWNAAPDDEVPFHVPRD